MRLPDANDQIRRAPVRALRAVFSGVGQLLLATDRLREEDARQQEESDEGQHDTLATWDGRLSSSVRLISPTGMPVPGSQGAGSTQGGTSEPTGRALRPRGRKSERGAASKPKRAGPRLADGQPKRAGQPGRGDRPAADTAQPAEPARADRSGTAAKPASRGAKNGAAAKRGAGAKAGSAGSGRKSGRPKHAAEPSRFRSLDLTGNVRMLTNQDIADLAEDHIERSTDMTGMPSLSDTAPSWSSWSTSAEPPQPADLPISGYDDLSLPSLRARLRNLGAAELLHLLAHERSHANREDVVTMFERRIAKLADGS